VHVTLILAMTADGKIGDAARTSPHFGAADRARLHRLCAQADVLVMGAGALRAEGATVRLNDALAAERVAAGRPPQPVTCVVSRRGDLDRRMPFLSRQQVPRVLAVADEHAAAARGRLGDLAAVWACGSEQVDLERLAAQLAAHGLSQVALLGGGAFNAAWLSKLPIHRLELTLAPWLFGGADAPTPLDGEGLPEPRRLELVGSETVEDGLLFLSYVVLP
jgi:5-amino-6-(5-phosphoribosylamino)uracil reductase